MRSSIASVSASSTCGDMKPATNWPSARQISSGSDGAGPESESCSADLLFETKIRMKPTNTVATMPRTIRIRAERVRLGLLERSEARALANGSLLHRHFVDTKPSHGIHPEP